MSYVVIFILSVGLGYLLGRQFQIIEDKINGLLKRNIEPEGGVSTPLPPNYSASHTTSSIVTPKSPDQVEREQEAKLREMNGL